MMLALYIYMCMYDFFLHSDTLFGAAPFELKKKCKTNIAFEANNVVSLKLHCFGLQPVSCSLSHSTTYHNLCFSSLDLFVLWPWSITILCKIQEHSYLFIIWGKKYGKFWLDLHHKRSHISWSKQRNQLPAWDFKNSTGNKNASVYI